LWDSVKLNKLFNTHNFAISYTEIKDIIKLEKTVQFILIDKSILSFHYDSDKDYNDRLRLLCKDYQQETGIEPTFLAENLK
jgi:hypothetical protein